MLKLAAAAAAVVFRNYRRLVEATIFMGGERMVRLS
jgi:hypothetical protein